jgi:hypothetical protein
VGVGFQTLSAAIENGDSLAYVRGSPVVTMTYKQIASTFAGSELVDQWTLPSGGRAIVAQGDQRRRVRQVTRVSLTPVNH